MNVLDGTSTRRAAAEGHVDVFVDVVGDGPMGRGMALLAAWALRILDALAPAKRRSLPLGSTLGFLEFGLQVVDLTLECLELLAQALALGSGHRLPSSRALGTELPLEGPDLSPEAVALGRGLCGFLPGRTLGSAKPIALGHRLLPGQTFCTQPAAQVANPGPEAPQPISDGRKRPADHLAQATLRSRRRSASHAPIMISSPSRTTFRRLVADQPGVSITCTRGVSSCPAVNTYARGLGHLVQDEHQQGDGNQ